MKDLISDADFKSTCSILFLFVKTRKNLIFLLTNLPLGVHSGWIRQIRGNDPSEIIIMAILSFELIYGIFDSQFTFVSDALSINRGKKWNLADKLPQIPLFRKKKSKKTPKILNEATWTRNRLETAPNGQVEWIAGVLRDILTKFQEILSTSSRKNLILVYF